MEDDVHCPFHPSEEAVFLQDKRPCMSRGCLCNVWQDLDTADLMVSPFQLLSKNLVINLFRSSRRNASVTGAST